MTVYKQGQGHITRISAVALSALIGVYAGFCWYSWRLSSQSSLTMHDSSGFYSLGAVLGGALLMTAIIGGGFWLSYFKPTTGEFLIDVDGEMRKVVWPEVLPLFDPQTSAWGSTYVVIITSIILTVYIALIDLIFDWTLTLHLLKWLLAV